MAFRYTFFALYISLKTMGNPQSKLARSWCPRRHSTQYSTPMVAFTLIDQCLRTSSAGVLYWLHRSRYVCRSGSFSTRDAKPRQSRPETLRQCKGYRLFPIVTGCSVIIQILRIPRSRKRSSMLWKYKFCVLTQLKFSTQRCMRSENANLALINCNGALNRSPIILRSDQEMDLYTENGNSPHISH